MALQSNTREQLAKRLSADLGLRFPEGSVALSAMTSGDPLITLTVSSVDVAVIAITRRTFNGFNVVAELSASAAEGLPEHISWLAVRTDQSQTMTARLAAAVKMLGTSSMKLIFQAAVNASVISDSNVTAEIVNDARLGAVGQ